MKYDEKDIEEYLNSYEVQHQIEVDSTITTIVQLLYQKKIITEKEFNETRSVITEIAIKEIKKGIKQEIENMEE